MNKIIPKKWGQEDWIEVNDKYVVKKLIMKKRHRCSLQYHELKHETFYVLSGKLKFIVGTNENNLQEMVITPGFSCALKPGVIHRMEALEDSEYIECSTTELNDVVRLQDDYGRV